MAEIFLVFCCYPHTMNSTKTSEDIQGRTREGREIKVKNFLNSKAFFMFSREIYFQTDAFNLFRCFIYNSAFFAFRREKKLRNKFKFKSIWKRPEMQRELQSQKSCFYLFLSVVKLSIMRGNV